MRYLFTRSGALLILAAIGCRHAQSSPAGAPPTPAQPRLDMDFTVRPLRGGGPEVTAVAVRQEIRGVVDQTKRPLSLRVGIVYTSRAGIADRVDSLVMRD